jgi:SPP1 gp7 family putative phage head morphogenesis protein
MRQAMILSDSPLYARAFTRYLRKGTPIEISIKALQESQRPRYYIWRTQSDDKVRASHAANNGRVFAWDNPPATGHPGADFGCRCWAEPYIRGQSEFANQVVSPILQAQSQWTAMDFIAHFYFGRGRAVTLSQVGHLAGVSSYYFYDIIRDGKSTHERINTQIIQAARGSESGSLTLSFDSSYSFADYRYYFGGGKVEGTFSGSVRKAEGMIYIDGNITYRYSDTFTDPLSIRERIVGTSEPLDSALIAVWATDFSGVFYDIVGTWEAKFSAAVKQNPKNSRYP